MAETNLDAGSL